MIIIIIILKYNNNDKKRIAITFRLEAEYMNTVTLVITITKVLNDEKICIIIEIINTIIIIII